jgi:hypothetical protein
MPHCARPNPSSVSDHNTTEHSIARLGALTTAKMPTCSSEFRVPRTSSPAGRCRRACTRSGCTGREGVPAFARTIPPGSGVFGQRAPCASSADRDVGPQTRWYSQLHGPLS